MKAKVSKEESSVHRTTRQRSLILEILERNHAPVSAAQIIRSAKKQIAKINKTTIYRSLERLQSEGQVNALMLIPGLIHYELSKHAGHHHHFVCKVCEKVFCLSGCSGGLGALVPEGFTLEEHEILLRGKCALCARC